MRRNVRQRRKTMVENMNVWDIARKRTYQKKSSINDNRGKDDYILLSNFFFHNFINQ